jgi:hypothetical protein
MSRSSVIIWPPYVTERTADTDHERKVPDASGVIQGGGAAEYE